MNNRRTLALALALLAAGGLTARSQTLDAPAPLAPPPPPYLLPPPEQAAWTVTVEGRVPGQTNGAPILVERQVVQSGNLRREINRWSNQSRTEDWCVEGKWLLEDPKEHAVTVIDPDHTPSANLLLKERLMEVGWIGAETYVRAAKVEGRTYHVYKRDHIPATVDENEPIRGGEAWVDAETKLLAAYNVGDRTYRIKYLPPPSAELTLPPAHAKAWKKFQDDTNPLSIPQPPAN